MRINADFSEKAIVRPGDAEWVPSPLPGVERQMLDRIGGEVARATTIVRYAAGSTFDPHTHGGGEEFLVLEGVFSDEHGDYPAGTYVRNPIGTAHKPFSKQGCTILVKLHQFADDDRHQFAMHLDDMTFENGGAPGVDFAWLHHHGPEQVKMVRWAAGSRFPEHVHPGGSEVYVLEGTLSDEGGDYPAGTWIRHGDGSRHAPYSREGALTWTKTGHLSADVLGEWAEQ